MHRRELTSVHGCGTVHKRGLIVKIPLKEGLNTIPTKEQRVLLDLFRIFPVIVVHMLLIKVVLRAWRHIGRDQLLIDHCLPLKVVEPSMLLDLMITV